MSSRSISLAALSCVLLVSGTGCSQISNMVSNRASESLEGAITETIEQAQAATTTAEVIEEEPEQPSQAGYITAAKEASNRAQSNAETAVTRAEWTQVDGDWQQAINNLEAVSEESAEYGEARTLLASYKNNQAAAAKNYASADQARYAVLTSSPVNDAPKAGTFEADARQVREWLYKGEFKKVNTLLRSSLSSNRRTGDGAMYADAVLVNTFNSPGVVYQPKLMEKINEWVEAEPKNAMAYVVRSYSNQVPITATQLRLVREDARDNTPELSSKQLMVSAIDSEVALELESGNRMALLAKLRTSKAFEVLGIEAQELTSEFDQEGLEALFMLMAFLSGSASPEDFEASMQEEEPIVFEPDSFEDAFAQANAAMPNSFEVVREKAQFLFAMDRSGTDALEYLRPVAASASAGSAVPMLIPVMHFYIGSELQAMDEHLQKPEVWPEVQKNAERAIAGLPDSALFPAWYSHMASSTNNDAIASKYMQIAMNKGNESPLVQSFLRMMM